MYEINLFNEFIRIDIFVGFGYYSILFFLTRLFTKNNQYKNFLRDFDRSVVEFIIYLGFVWLFLWFLGLFLFYLGLENEAAREEFYDRLFGEYAYAVWLQPIFWFSLTQLLRIDIIKKYLIFRVLLSVLFVLTFEMVTILVTSWHSDYLPSSWALDTGVGLETGSLVFGLIVKVLIALVIFTSYHFGSKKLQEIYGNDSRS